MALTIKQLRYRKNRLAGMTKWAAAINAGYSPNTARNAKKHIENHINFDATLQKHGLTDEKLGQHAADGLEANKKIITENGEFETADWSSRHKYFESICRIRGLMLDRYDYRQNFNLNQNNFFTVINFGDSQKNHPSSRVCNLDQPLAS